MTLKTLIRTLGVALTFCFASALAAEERGPVVVELYTSQGCSSCPPADALLHDLAKRDDVIALALHVDYWDYIGWKDVFGNPAHAERQRDYAAAAGKRMVYTPQMVIGGKDHVVGTKPMQIADLIMSHSQAPDPIKVTVSRDGKMLKIATTGTGRVGPVDVHVVRYSERETVRITRGENRGRTLTYANVVRAFDTIGNWSRGDALDITAEISGDLPVAVLVQEPGQGAILGAAALR